MIRHLGNLFLLILIGCFAFGFGIGRRDLWAPDEPRFGQVTREMLQRRDPFVLRVNGWAYPALDPVKSGRPFAEELLKRRRSPDEPIGIYEFFRADYMVYGDYRLTEIERDEETGDPQLHAFLRQPRRALLIMREKRLESLRELYPDLPMRLLFARQVGGRELVVVDNQPSNEAGRPPSGDETVDSS
jgi:hypothetical protein